MDVARLMIRTSRQCVVDEFVDVKVNGNFFRLRVLEDSYGPMRIMIPQNSGPEGRDGDESEEEREDEEFMRLMVEEEVADRYSEMGEENHLAITTVKNANVDNNVPDFERNVTLKKGVHQPKEIVLSGNVNIHPGGMGRNKGGNQEENRMLEDEFLVGQGGGIGGSQNSLNTDCSLAGGVVRNLTMYDVAGQLVMSEEIGLKRQKGGVYSDGPRSVYFKLTKEDSGSKVGNNNHFPPKHKYHRVHPLPASVRKQQHIIQQLKLKIPSPDVPSHVSCSIPSEHEVSSRRTDADAHGVYRNSPSRFQKGAKV
jgi:hypothetical protein